jgi:fumarate reductase flavoprotein subunit
MQGSAVSDESFDVIVIGAGGSGLAAAAAAAQAGARVLVLEKQPQIGGTTRLAVGSISAAGTRLQRAAGVHDEPLGFQADMAAFTADLLPRDNERLRAMLAREAGPTVDWLEDQGVAFVGPYPEPPHRLNRMHNTVPGPRLIVQRLERTARRHGAVIHMNVSTQALLREGERVVGVAYSADGKAHQAKARGGVVLASGDFSGNAAMRSQHLASGAARARPINPGNQGDGFALAQATGAARRNMDAIFGPQLRFPRAARAGLDDRLPAWPWLARCAAAFFMRAPPWLLKPLVTSLLIANMSPSPGLFEAGALLVDSQGRLLDAKKASDAVAHTPDGTAYVVMAASVAERFSAQPYYISTAPGIAYAYLADYERGRPELVHRATGAAGLAQQLGMDQAALAQSLGALGAQSLSAESLGALVALGPVHAMLTTTEGSLAVDTDCRVLDENERVIPGLYAVGCMGQGGMLLRGHGLHLAWAFTSGRIAGLRAAAAANHIRAPAAQPNLAQHRA